MASGIEALVCADIDRRQKAGIAKYGTTVAANPLSLKAWLQHAYEEALDQAIYLKRAIAEIEGTSPRQEVCANCDSTLPEGCGGTFMHEPECQRRVRS